MALGEWMPSQVPQADLAKQSRFFERGYEGSLCALCLGRAWPVCVARGVGEVGRIARYALMNFMDYYYRQ